MTKYKHKSRKRGIVSQGKRKNSLRQQVREIGCNNFGILAVDSSKKNFCVQLSNFWGEVLWGPKEVPNTKGHLENLLNTLNACLQEFSLKDLVVGIEQTGRYHLPIKRVLEKQWPIKIIHPFTTKQLRQPFSSGTKTDDIDLEAMTRAIISGYGSIEPHVPDAYCNWQCINRMREDLVKKRSTIKAQCQERIQMLMPGYSSLFNDFWSREVALELIKEFRSTAKLLKTDTETIYQCLQKRGVSCQRKTLHKVKTWALNVPSAESTAPVEHRMLCNYLEILCDLTKRIDQFEIELLEYLVMTPGILLLSISGINVVSASGYTSELGPIANYPRPSSINGRAGLYPSCYQSDEVCRPDGPMVGGRNARLRDAIMEVVHNLMIHNDHFHSMTEMKKKQKWADKKIRISIANRFNRISYHMLAGNEVYNHPTSNGHDSILTKIIRFSADHNMSPDATFKLADTAMQRLPLDALKSEENALKSTAWRSMGTPRHYGLSRKSSIRKIINSLPKFVDSLKQFDQKNNKGKKDEIIKLRTS